MLDAGCGKVNYETNIVGKKNVNIFDLPCCIFFSNYKCTVALSCHILIAYPRVLELFSMQKMYHPFLVFPTFSLHSIL
jgi:hypothetical protein